MFCYQYIFLNKAMKAVQEYIYRLVELNPGHREQQRKPFNIKPDI